MELPELCIQWEGKFCLIGCYEFLYNPPIVWFKCFKMKNFDFFSIDFFSKNRCHKIKYLLKKLCYISQYIFYGRENIKMFNFADFNQENVPVTKYWLVEAFQSFIFRSKMLEILIWHELCGEVTFWKICVQTIWKGIEALEWSGKLMFDVRGDPNYWQLLV